MKLAAVTQSYAPTGGGVRTMLHAQRAWCRGQGIEHVLVVPGAEDSCTREDGTTTYTVASPRVPGSQAYRLLLRSDKVLRLLRAELPDVVETHCAYNLPWTAFRHRRKHGGLVSAIYMTDLPVAYVETPLARRIGRRGAGLARRLVERYLRALYARCDVTVALSAAAAERLRGLGVPRVFEVPLGVDVDTFSPARRDPAVRTNRLGGGADDLVLVYVGRLDREKQPDVVVDAFTRLPPEFGARLVLVGDGPLREALAERLRSTGRGTVLPFVQDRAELAALLASADVYVSAMRHETFGLSVLEAQACGLPVVGVRAGAMVERVPEGTGLLVEPGAADALADAIAATPRAEWARMGSRARRMVESDYSWQRTCAALLDLYRAAR